MGLDRAPDRSRVVVIGGGIAGASVLYHLARLGWTDSVLVERGHLTSGSTWHAAGLCTQFNASLPLMRVLMRSLQLYEELGAVLFAGADLDTGWAGWMDGAITSGSRAAGKARLAIGSTS